MGFFVVKTLVGYIFFQVKVYCLWPFFYDGFIIATSVYRHVFVCAYYIIYAYVVFFSYFEQIIKRKTSSPMAPVLRYSYSGSLRGPSEVVVYVKALLTSILQRNSSEGFYIHSYIPPNRQIEPDNVHSLSIEQFLIYLHLFFFLFFII